MGLFAEDMRVSFFHQPVCVRSKDAAHLLSLLSLPPPACLRSSAAANRPPPSLRSTLSPLSLAQSTFFHRKNHVSLSLSRSIYLFSLSLRFLLLRTACQLTLLLLRLPHQLHSRECTLRELMLAVSLSLSFLLLSRVARGTWSGAIFFAGGIYQNL